VSSESGRGASPTVSDKAVGDSSRSYATYVYGIVPDAAIPRLTKRGVEGADDVRAVVSGPAAALVSNVKTMPVRATRANLMAHSDVLQEAIQESDVLPMRFGFVMDTDDAVRDELLGRRRRELADLLSEMAGRVEMAVKVYYLEDAVLTQIITDNPSIARLRESTRGLPGDAGYYQRIRLGEVIASAIEIRRTEDSAKILERLNTGAVRSVRDTQTPEQMVLKASFLVERDRVPAFQTLASELAAEGSSSMQFTCLGPLPPYSFVQLRAPAEAPMSTRS
jgi:hypothetical protein